MFASSYYMPNYLSNYSLWKLCIYVNPKLKRFEHLFEEFRTQFFPYLDYHMILHHNISRLDKNEIGYMKRIVEKLMNELRELVIQEGLISKTDEDETAI